MNKRDAWQQFFDDAILMGFSYAQAATAATLKVEELTLQLSQVAEE